MSRSTRWWPPDCMAMLKVEAMAHAACRLVSGLLYREGYNGRALGVFMTHKRAQA